MGLKGLPSRLHLGTDAPLYLGEVHRRRGPAREAALDLGLECLRARIHGRVLLLERPQGGADHIVRRAEPPTSHLLLHQPLELFREMDVHMYLPVLPVRLTLCPPCRPSAGLPGPSTSLPSIRGTGSRARSSCADKPHPARRLLPHRHRDYLVPGGGRDPAPSTGSANSPTYYVPRDTASVAARQLRRSERPLA